jgi:hypothetical protein
MHGKICALAKMPPTAISKIAKTIILRKLFKDLIGLPTHQLPDHLRVRVEEVSYPSFDEGYRDSGK